MSTCEQDYGLSPAQFHNGLRQLWRALGKEDSGPQDVDVFTLCANKITALEAIVDKLPKCWRLDESGVLQHDVPLIVHEHPKVLVFTQPYSTFARPGPDHDWCWLTIRGYAHGFLSGTIHGCSRTGFLPVECYDSLEAAAIAKAAGEEVAP